MRNKTAKNSNLQSSLCDKWKRQQQQQKAHRNATRHAMMMIKFNERFLSILLLLCSVCVCVCVALLFCRGLTTS